MGFMRCFLAEGLDSCPAELSAARWLSDSIKTQSSTGNSRTPNSQANASPNVRRSRGSILVETKRCRGGCLAVIHGLGGEFFRGGTQSRHVIRLMMRDLNKSADACQDEPQTAIRNVRLQVSIAARKGSNRAISQAQFEHLRSCPARVLIQRRKQLLKEISQTRQGRLAGHVGEDVELVKRTLAGVGHAR